MQLARIARDPSLARLPISRWKIEEDLLQMMLAQSFGELFLGIVVWEQILYGGESIPLCRGETIKKIKLGE